MIAFMSFSFTLAVLAVFGVLAAFHRIKQERRVLDQWSDLAAKELVAAKNRLVDAETRLIALEAKPARKRGRK